MASNCTDCRVKVTQASKALQCHKCGRWTHTRCLDVPDTLYEQLKSLSLPCLPYVCKSCLPKLGLLCDPTASPHATPVTVKKRDHRNRRNQSPASDVADTSSVNTDQEVLNVTCIPVSASTPTPSPDNTLVDPTPSNDIPPKTYADAVTTRSSRKKTSTKQATKSLKHDVPPPVQDIADRVRHLEEIITKHPPLGTATSSSSSSQRPNRDRCLIIIRAPESTKESPAERMLDDQNFLQAMVSTLFDDAEDGINVVSAFRLGKKHGDPLSNPRPLKVVLKDSEEARRVFTRTSRLKGLDYRVLRDLCPEDRLRMRDAVQELKQRRSLGETNLQIVDFQVVVRRPRVVWHPVAILPRACLPN